VGLLDFIKPKSALEKAAAQVREPYAQPEYRRGAMDKLFELGSDEAYRALLKRFTIAAHGQIADESEKRDLVEQLAQVGAPTLPALKDFVQTEKKNISFPIQAVVKIMGKPDATTFLKETLQQYEPLDHRSVQAKTTLVIILGELVDASEAGLFVPYLEDHDDDVQFQALVALERLANEAASREAMVNVCTTEQHSARVKRRAAQALLELGWSVKERYGDFDPELKDEFLLGKKGQLVKKHGAAEEA
jgi:hypothetical protein